jgi:hypothetical protein
MSSRLHLVNICSFHLALGKQAVLLLEFLTVSLEARTKPGVWWAPSVSALSACVRE